MFATDAPSPQWRPLPAWFRSLVAQHENAVLLETALPDGPDDQSLLFLHPEDELIASTPEEFDRTLAQVERCRDQGKYVAGYFNYECGEHFVGLTHANAVPSPTPLAWMGVFSSPLRFRHNSGSIEGDVSSNNLPNSITEEIKGPRSTSGAKAPATFALLTARLKPCPSKTTALSTGSQAPSTEDAAIMCAGLEIAPEDYRAAIEQIQRYLADGHTYQVNFTDRIRGEVHSSPLSVYATLLRQQPVPFAAFLNRPGGAVLSFSPEMFFRIAGNTVTVRPMKGTWSRGVHLQEEREAIARFREDEKNRSEHVMIVDLLRNDLGRVCRMGSVEVADLFRIEPYQTLLQMTSTITGTLGENITPTEVFRTLFPSGSITGAPKRRTMEIIHELERRPRGIYTGAIGHFGPQGDACFNVAIRTLELRGNTFTMGVGGGITVGSQAEQEYEECRLKGSFLTNRRPAFSLIETMRFEGGRIRLLPLHLERLAASAAYFGIRYDEKALHATIEEAVLQCGGQRCRVRLLMDEHGSTSITATPLEETTWAGRLRLADTRVHSRDVFVHHKTTHRALYDEQLAGAHADGFDEVLFLNENGGLTEGAISNIFLKLGGRWLTPALHCGVLPGVQRAVLLRGLPNAEESVITLGDLRLAEAVLVCNAVRGARAVSRIETSGGALLWSRTV